MIEKSAPMAVLGSGGHAKVILSTLQELGYTRLAVFDDDTSCWGQEVLGVAVAGPLVNAVERDFECGIIAIGNNTTRQTIAKKIKLQWLSLVHPTAFVHNSVKLGAGSVVFAGAVIQADAGIGDHVIVNTAATVDHDCVIENYVHLAPGTHLAGNVHIGEGTLMGVGSAAIPGVKIGAWTTVGASGVVVSDLPESIVAVGVPARPKKLHL